MDSYISKFTNREIHHEHTENGFFHPDRADADVLAGKRLEPMGSTKSPPWRAAIMSFKPLTASQNRWLNQTTEQWIDQLNVTVPLHAVDEWIHARQKLGILYRITHIDRLAIFRPTPASFGDLDAVDSVCDEMEKVFHAMTMAGVPEGHPICEAFEPACDAVMKLAPAFQKRQAQAVQLGLQAPLFVPVGLVPAMNDFTKWADGDRCEDRESWLVAGPKPTFPSFNF
jgi:hypothetical protein